MLEVKNLTVGYVENIDILSNVSISAAPGKITCVIGPNGAGKSTLLKAIYGMLDPNKGHILLDSKEITGLKPYELLKFGISLIPQEGGIFPYLSVESNLKIGAWTFRGDKKRIDRELAKIYGRYPFLSNKAKNQASTLSGGEQRILDLAKSLIASPNMILADEPTAGLSVKFYNQVYEELRNLKEIDKKSILLVDQNVRGAIGIADYVYVLVEGKNNIQGPKEQFGEGNATEVVRSWLAFE
ncbi:MAG: ABC transporter ATP-binding protein [Nitrososphaerales archaeon]